MATDFLHVTDGRDAGAQIGESATEKLGFWGVTPGVQPTITGLTTTPTTTQVATFAAALGDALEGIGLIVQE